MAIIIALQWVEEVKPHRTVICSDSMFLSSIQIGKSICRQDLLDEISQLIFRLGQQNIYIEFTWIPAHVGIKGNEKVDKLAKDALKADQIEIKVPLSKSEIKVIIKDSINRRWQVTWDQEKKGRHLYSIQKEVIGKKYSGLSRQEENMITRLRIGHTSLNGCLRIIGKHQTGLCTHCGEVENVEHILLRYRKYSEKRKELERITNNELCLKKLLGMSGEQSLIKAVIISERNSTCKQDIV